MSFYHILYHTQTTNSLVIPVEDGKIVDSRKLKLKDLIVPVLASECSDVGLQLPDDAQRRIDAPKMMSVELKAYHGFAGPSIYHQVQSFIFTHFH